LLLDQILTSEFAQEAINAFSFCGWHVVFFMLGLHAL